MGFTLNFILVFCHFSKADFIPSTSKQKMSISRFVCFYSLIQKFGGACVVAVEILCRRKSLSVFMSIVRCDYENYLLQR